MKNLPKMMNVKTNSIVVHKLLSISLFLLFFNCSGQVDQSNNENSDREQLGTGKAMSEVSCNRASYSKRYIKKLPDYICLPDSMAIDDNIRFSDLNGDGEDNFMAFRFKKEISFDTRKDGDTIYWKFYLKNIRLNRYEEYLVLDNIIPPFLKHTSQEYRKKMR